MHTYVPLHTWISTTRYHHTEGEVDHAWWDQEYLSFVGWAFPLSILTPTTTGPRRRRWEERKREPSCISHIVFLIPGILIFSAPARTWSLYSLIPPCPNTQCEFEIKGIMVVINVLLIAQQSYLIVHGSIILIWWTPLKNRSSSNRLISSCSKEWVGFSCWWVVVGFRSKNMVTMKPVWLVEIVPMRPCTKPSSLVTNQ